MLEEIDGLAGTNVQDGIKNLREQIVGLSNSAGWQFYPLMGASELLPGGQENNGASGKLDLYQIVGGNANPFEAAEQVIGEAAGAGIDYVLPGLTAIPDDARAIVVKAYLGMDEYGWVDLYLGNIANIYTTEPVLSVGVWGNASGGTVADMEHHNVCPWVVVSLSSTKTFKMRVKSSGSTSLGTEGIWVRLTLLGYFK